MTSPERYPALVMIEERRATSLTYEAAKDLARIPFEDNRQDESAGTLPAVTDAKLLLDAYGFLVGVDLGDNGSGRTVVMLGAHEDVARVVEAPVAVVRVGTGDRYELRIEAARERMRASEKNPYVG